MNARAPSGDAVRAAVRERLVQKPAPMKFAAVPFAFAFLAACSGSSSGTKESNASYPCDDAAFVALQSQFQSGSARGDREVYVCGQVTHVSRARRTRSGTHGYFDVAVASGDTVEVVCNLDEMDAPAWPWVHTGSYSYVQGRYYYDNAYSQGIDWTHRGTSRSWPQAGYVVVDGKRYE